MAAAKYSVVSACTGPQSSSTPFTQVVVSGSALHGWQDQGEDGTKYSTVYCSNKEIDVLPESYGFF